jgi:pyruvate dehydrogenase (quinone)
MDGAPVLAITGHHYHDLIDTHSQQDVDLTRVFEDVTVYNTQIMSKAHVENVAELACRTALAYRGVAHICLPADLQDQSDGEMSPRVKKAPHHSSNVYAHSAGLPDEADLGKAAEVLNAGEKIAILAGQGALNATDELERLAETLGAPVIKALLGKAVLPDDSPYTTGGIGLLGTRPSQEAIEGCDTLLIVGSSFPYIEFYPKPNQARAVQIDLDPQRIGLL